MCNCTSENLDIPRCAIAHLRSGPSDHPGMTAPNINNSSSAPTGRRGNWHHRTTPGTPARALHEEADVELVGHAHAAVHLHALLHRKRRGRARAGFGDRDRRAGAVEIRIQRLQRLQYCSAGDLDLDVELGGAMLQCLEFTDRLAELLA